MARRNKTKFEKFFSLNRYIRRINAKQLSSSIKTDFKIQKNIIIDGEKKYADSRSDNLEEHFAILKKEFANESELIYTHAKIIVLIRREYKVKYYFEIFEQLWDKEEKFLLKNLNTRWLLSAAETFADNSHDNSIKSLAIACTCLINTIKLYETERFITDAEILSDDKIDILQRERVPLFDGISAFKVGTDDTLRNMRWRIDELAKINITGKILLEIFTRLQKHDTVYKRFKNRHTRKETGWW